MSNETNEHVTNLRELGNLATGADSDDIHAAVEHIEELRAEVERYEQRPPTFAELDNLATENADLRKQLAHHASELTGLRKQYAMRGDELDKTRARIAELEAALLAMPDDNSPKGVEYTDWLTGADGTRKQPYPQRRNRSCAIGYHDSCTDPAGESCGCPCHWLAEREGE